MRREGISTPTHPSYSTGSTLKKNRRKVAKTAQRMHTHTLEQDRWDKGGTGSLGYRILCLRISSGMRIRATVVRLTHAETRQNTKRQTWNPNANRWTYISFRTKQTHTGNRLPIAGLTSDSKHRTIGYGLPIVGLMSIS